MKKIRKCTFETNSSSAHSLVLYKKEVDTESNKEVFDIRNSIFGFNFELEYTHFDDEWDENNKLVFLEKDSKHPFVWDFNRGKARYYDDTFNKVAFIIAYNKYDKKFDLKGFLDKVDSWFNEYSKFLNERQLALKEKLIDKDFRNEKYIENNISAEFDYETNIIDKLLENDDLLKKFLFNSRSYISISGDEYDNYSLKCVGSETDYYDFFGNRSDNDIFFKRADEVYPKEEYDITFGV